MGILVYSLLWVTQDGIPKNVCLTTVDGINLAVPITTNIPEFP